MLSRLSLVAAIGLCLTLNPRVADVGDVPVPAFTGRDLLVARELFVAPDGAGDNPGTRDRPLSLREALSADSPARPGDVLWLRGGTYRGAFVSALEGLPGAPIVVRQAPGERAVIDSAGLQEAALTVVGSWTVFWGFEITNSDPKRRSDVPGSWPPDLGRSAGVSSRGAQNQFVNLVIHDLTDGIGLWSESRGSLAYGNIIFYNGWQGPDRSHGHGIYVQNEVGAREVAENVIFNQFSHGIHAYGSRSAYLNDITLRGNVVFNNGLIGESGAEREILLGGGRRAENAVVDQNATYGPGHSMLGYAAGCREAVVSRNHLVGSVPLSLEECDPIMQGNVFIGAADDLREQYPDNRYFDRPPGGTTVMIRPNRYERDRAHVVVYNWDRLSAVAIDPSGVLPDRSPFEVRDVQDYFGAPVATGVYTRGSTIDIPMTNRRVTAPVGDVPVHPRHTAPEFAVFVLRATGAAARP